MSVVRLQDHVTMRSDIQGVELSMQRLEAGLDELRSEMRELKISFTAMKDSVDRRIDRVFFAVMAMPVAIIAAVETIFG